MIERLLQEREKSDCVVIAIEDCLFIRQYWETD